MTILVICKLHDKNSQYQIEFKFDKKNPNALHRLKVLDVKQQIENQYNIPVEDQKISGFVLYGVKKEGHDETRLFFDPSYNENDSYYENDFHGENNVDLNLHDFFERGVYFYNHLDYKDPFILNDTQTIELFFTRVAYEYNLIINKDINNQIIMKHVGSDNTIEELKDIIEYQTNIPMNKQNLLFGNEKEKLSPMTKLELVEDCKVIYLDFV